MSAERTSQAAAAAQELCTALWQALRQQLQAGRSEEAAKLGESIAEVSRSVVALAKLESPCDHGETQAAAEATPDEERRSHPAQAGPAIGGWLDVAERSDRDEPLIVGADEPGGRAASDLGGGALLIDERADADGPIAIRATRQSAQSGSWSAAVQRRLERHREDGAPFAVLLLELLDLERLRLAQPPMDAERQVREVETAIVEQLRPADALVREIEGRYWLVALDTGAADAKALAIRLGAAVRRSASHRGVPLELAVGIAVCPDHGAQEGALLSHAEIDLYAAQAKGAVISDPDDGEPAA